MNALIDFLYDGWKRALQLGDDNKGWDTFIESSGLYFAAVFILYRDESM